MQDFLLISVLCGTGIKDPCHYLHESNILPLIGWTSRVMPVSDPQLITETIILRIHRLTFSVISGRSLSTLIGISCCINGNVSSVTGAILHALTAETAHLGNCPLLLGSPRPYPWAGADLSDQVTGGSWSMTGSPWWPHECYGWMEQLVLQSVCCNTRCSLQP